MNVFGRDHRVGRALAANHDTRTDAGKCQPTADQRLVSSCQTRPETVGREVRGQSHSTTSAALYDHAVNPLRIRDVIEWISVEQDEVSDLLLRHGSECIGEPKEPRRIQRCRSKRIKRAKPSTDQQGQFIVQARTWI
jgi:hypothetical protein